MQQAGHSRLVPWLDLSRQDRKRSQELYPRSRAGGQQTEGQGCGQISQGHTHSRRQEQISEQAEVRARREITGIQEQAGSVTGSPLVSHRIKGSRKL